MNPPMFTRHALALLWVIVSVGCGQEPGVGSEGDTAESGAHHDAPHEADSSAEGDALIAAANDATPLPSDEGAEPSDEGAEPGDEVEITSSGEQEVSNDDDATMEAQGDVPLPPRADSDSPPGAHDTEGSGPEVAEGDMDGDGIPDDADEDIDGDGYTNADELHAGTDPEDPDSVIYVGGWPYNANKDAINDPGWDSEPTLGSVMPNYQAFDQHGDLVSLYDFAMSGKPVVIDVVTWTCEPCKAMAEYFSEGDASVMDDFLFFADKYDVIRDLIEQGDIHWITVIWSGGSVVDQSDAALWEETWPNPKVTVLADSDLQLQEYLFVKAMPRIDVLDEEMTFVAFCDNDVPCDYELEGGGPGGPVAGLKWLESYYQSLYGAP